MTPAVIVLLIMLWLIVAGAVALVVGRSIRAADRHDAEEHRETRRLAKRALGGRR